MIEWVAEHAVELFIGIGVLLLITVGEPFAYAAHPKPGRPLTTGSGKHPPRPPVGWPSLPNGVKLIYRDYVPGNPWTGEPMTTLATSDLDTLYKHLESMDPEAFATTHGWTITCSDGPFRRPLTIQAKDRQSAMQNITDLRESIGDSFTVTVEIAVRIRADLPEVKSEGEGYSK